MPESSSLLDVFELDGIELNRMLVKDVMSPTSAVSIARKGETIADAIATMKKSRLRELPVLDGDKAIGCVTYSSFLTRRRLPFSSKVEHAMQPCPRIEEDMNLVQAAQEMVSAGVRGAPVVRVGKVVGFISRTDLMKILPKVDSLRDKKVSDFMTGNPLSVTEGESLRKAQMIMKDLNEKALPVVDDQFRLIGVVGMTEILEAMWSSKEHAKPDNEMRGQHEREPPEPTVGALMSRPGISVPPTENLAKVANTMVDRSISVVFVTDRQRLVGVVSQADLMEQIISTKQQEGVYVQITGLEEGDPDAYTEMYNMIEKSMQRINPIAPPRMFTIHVTMFHPEGLRSKYSMHGRLATPRKLYFGRSFDWSLFSALDELLDGLEKSVKKDHQIMVDRKHSVARAGPENRPY